jgi:hypothetical protein
MLRRPTLANEIPRQDASIPRRGHHVRVAREDREPDDASVVLLERRHELPRRDVPHAHVACAGEAIGQSNVVPVKR